MSFLFTGVVLFTVAAQVLSFVVLVGIIRGKYLHICSVVMLLLEGVCCLILGFDVSPSMGDAFISNKEILTITSFYYPYFSVLIGALLFLGMRAIEAWDEATRRARKEREQKKAYHKERRRRLRFPGHYSKLYYRFFWKDLMFRWKDIIYLFWSIFLSGILIFMGFGIYQVFSNNYGEDGGMLGLGLVEIVRDFLIAIVLVSLFLIALTLSFYQKRKLVSAGIIQTLGIRSQTLFGSWIMELAGCFLTAILGVFAIGTVLLELLCRNLSSWLSDYEKATTVSYSLYLWTIVGMLLICSVAYLVSKEFGGNTESTDTRIMVVKWEKIRGKYTPLITGLVVLVSVACLYFYAQRRTAENIVLVCVFLLCSTLLYGVYGGFICRESKKKQKTLFLYFRKTIGYVIVSVRLRDIFLY